MSHLSDKLKEVSNSSGLVAKLEAQVSRLSHKVKDNDA